MLGSLNWWQKAFVDWEEEVGRLGEFASEVTFFKAQVSQFDLCLGFVLLTSLSVLWLPWGRIF
jgi:hypothetical protein